MLSYNPRKNMSFFEFIRLHFSVYIEYFLKPVKDMIIYRRTYRNFVEVIKKKKETLNDILKFLEMNYSIDNFDYKQHHSYVAIKGPIAYNLLKNETIKKMSKIILPQFSRKFIKEKILVGKTDKPKMEQKDRDFLIELYHDDVKKLETILGRKFPWKNFN